MHWSVTACYRPEALRTPRDLPGAPSGMWDLPPPQTVSLVKRADPARPGSSATGARESKAGRAAGLLPRGLRRDLKAVLQLAPPLHGNALPR